LEATTAELRTEVFAKTLCMLACMHVAYGLLFLFFWSKECKSERRARRCHKHGEALRARARECLG
jgi:hypothetical protein